MGQVVMVGSAHSAESTAVAKQPVRASVCADPTTATLSEAGDLASPRGGKRVANYRASVPVSLNVATGEGGVAPSGVTSNAVNGLGDLVRPLLTTYQRAALRAEVDRHRRAQLPAKTRKLSVPSDDHKVVVRRLRWRVSRARRDAALWKVRAEASQMVAQRLAEELRWLRMETGQ